MKDTVQSVLDTIAEPEDLTALDDSTTAEASLPSGVALFDLIMSGKIGRAFPHGRITNLIGDSSSGKSMLAYTAFAAMAHNRAFAEYELVHDDVENANSFDVPKLFGSKTLERVKAPFYIDGLPAYSDTVQQFCANVDRQIASGRPFFYVLDSLDGLTSIEERERMEEQAKQVDKKWDDADTKGSYQMEIAKAMSQSFRRWKRELAKTNSHIVIISQVRDNIGNMWNKKTRSGGKALEFYSSHVVWLTKMDTIKATVGGEKYVIGVNCNAKVSKNRTTGKMRDIDYQIYYDLGVDDVLSCLEYLKSHDGLVKSGTKFSVPGIDFAGSMDALATHIDTNGGIPQLYAAVQKRWDEIEDKLSLTRKRSW